MATEYLVDTRSYNRRDFVQQLLADVCGSHLDAIDADEVINYLDEQVDITNYDGEVLSANRWRSDIEKELSL